MWASHWCRAGIGQWIRYFFSGFLFLFLFSPGAPPGNLVLGCKPQWRLCCVIVPWQISETLGENKGASYSWGRKGDGKDLGLVTEVLVGIWPAVPAAAFCLVWPPLSQCESRDLQEMFPALLSPIQQPHRDRDAIRGLHFERSSFSVSFHFM